MRNYIMKIDDGHDFAYVVYQSEHRNGSKANLEDARCALCRKYGWKEARNWRILDTHLTDRTEW